MTDTAITYDPIVCASLRAEHASDIGEAGGIQDCEEHAWRAHLDCVDVPGHLVCSTCGRCAEPPLRDDLVEALSELRIRRTVHTEIAAVLDVERTQALERFEAEHAHLIEGVRVADQARVDAEDWAREIARRVYVTTGERKPAPGCEIKMFKRLVYDYDRAMVWAKRHDLALIPERLDERAFGELARRGHVECVQIMEEPRVQIAKDLRSFYPPSETETQAADDESEGVPL